MYDIIIVGAGPAGLTAAIYAKRSNKKVLVFESSNPGGKIVNSLSIENYPAISQISGYDFANNIYNQAKELKAEFKFERVVKIINHEDYKEVITSKDKYKCLAVILATGNENRKLGLSKEKDFIGKGISYCATCDGNFFLKKDVAIVGGGNSAIMDAIYLSDIANKVYLIHKNNEFDAEEILINRLKEKSNIEIILNSKVIDINGSETLENITVENNSGKKTSMEVSGLFIAIGRNPQNESFKELVRTNEDGYIIAKEDCHTNVNGIFASGDNRVKELRQLVTACSDGAIAANEAIKYVNKK